VSLAAEAIPGRPHHETFVELLDATSLLLPFRVLARDSSRVADPQGPLSLQNLSEASLEVQQPVVQAAG
jgi:hypothetical protein